MKLVSVFIMTMFFSFGAAAQTTSNPTQKRAVVKIQQKRQVKKAKILNPKPGNADITTLKNERAYKAKWSFDQMLKRRLEIEVEEDKTQQRID